MMRSIEQLSNLTIMTLLLTVMWSACGQTIHTNRLKEIILVNSSSEKCEVAQLIAALDKCKPKTIGLNLLFSINENTRCDSQLLTAIENSGRVVLIEGIHDSLSDESFYERAKYTGETGLPRYDNGVADFYYRIAEYRLRYSFPFLVALQYDTIRASQLVAKSYPKHYPINVHYDQKDFIELSGVKDIAERANQISNKIVIIGNMDPFGNDIRLVESSNNSKLQMSATVLLANVILDILQDLDTPDVEINKYSEWIRQRQMKKNQD